MKGFLVLVLSFFVQAWDFATRLGSKTAYRPQQNASTYSSPPSTCGAMPVHAELIARHGARYATKGNTQQILNLQDKLRALPPSAPAWVRSWTNPTDPDQADMLALSGQVEHYEMGKRFRQNYPSLFTTPFHPFRYNYQSTWVPRAQQSGMSNVYGSLEGTGSLGPKNYTPPYMYTHPTTNDTILRFFDSCPKYSEVVAQYKTKIDAWGQANLGNVLKQAQSKVSDTITYSDLLVMYQACGYEYSLKNTAALMCSVFDDTSMAMMDLYTQFEGYFLKGPGLELSYQIASPLVVDILQSMQAYVAAGTNGSGMTLRFAHAETVAPLAAYMGLFAGGPPLAFDVRPSTLFNRSWDDSQVMPYGVNMMLLLYSCTDGYKVKMLYNEKEMQIPGCGDTLYCPWTKFYALNQKAFSFDFQAACKKSSSSSSSASSDSSSSGSSSSSSSSSSSASSSSRNAPSPASSSSSSSSSLFSSASSSSSSNRAPESCSALPGERCVPGQTFGDRCCRSGQCLRGICSSPCKGSRCRAN